jgi:uridine kinase
MEKMKSIIRNFWARNPAGRSVLGLDGLSRSGKTTLSQRIADYLCDQGIPYQLFHIDDFIVERERRYGTELEAWREYYFLQWETEELAEQFFSKLKSESEIRLDFYDSNSDCRICKKVGIPQAGIILIEGVFLQRPEWRHYLDGVFYVDCPKQQRYERESPEAKQNIEKLADRYWKAELYYEETIAPKERADWVIQNGQETGGET